MQVIETLLKEAVTITRSKISLQIYYNCTFYTESEFLIRFWGTYPLTDW